MAESVNPHYDKLLTQMNEGKDSIFEPCRVMSFDPKTLMATVRGIRSKSVKKNVIVLFPSMYMNTGIITFPMNNSVGLSFVGVDSEVYMLPAQFLPPVKETVNSVVKSNASPGQFDELMSLEHLEQGEVLLRSLGGAQVYIRNTGEVEMATSKMHRLSLNELEGSFETVVERERKYIGYSEHFDGVHDPNHSDDSKEHHIYSIFYEEVPDWETDEVLPAETVQRMIDGDFDSETEFILEEKDPIAKKQMVNVYNKDDSKRLSAVDGSELFYDFELYGKEKLSAEEKDSDSPPARFKMKLSKNGTMQTESRSADQTKGTIVTQGNNYFEARFEDTTAGIVSSVKMDESGEVHVTDSAGTYTLSDMMKRLRALENR